jgi:ribose 5-phosphate isomerase B
MRIALCSDEAYPVHSTVRQELAQRGHVAVSFGAVDGGVEQPWASVAEHAARAIVSGDCSEGIFFCWSGTGISMAANKLFGIRAALCVDPGSARAARQWNHANVICLSNRLLSDDMAKEILRVWFDTSYSTDGAPGVAQLTALDERWRRTDQ